MLVCFSLLRECCLATFFPLLVSCYPLHWDLGCSDKHNSFCRGPQPPSSLFPSPSPFSLPFISLWMKLFLAYIGFYYWGGLYVIKLITSGWTICHFIYYNVVQPLLLISSKMSSLSPKETPCPIGNYFTPVPLLIPEKESAFFRYRFPYSEYFAFQVWLCDWLLSLSALLRPVSAGPAVLYHSVQISDSSLHIYIMHFNCWEWFCFLPASSST